MDADSLARLAYFALLGAVLLGGVLAAYRGRLARGARDALGWVLIFLGFVAVYGLKDDIRRGLFPQDAVMISDNAVELRRGPDGHFRALARVNGVPVEFLVDTGASDVVLTREDAARVGFDPDALIYSRTARTANGVVSSAPVVLESLELGAFKDRNVPAAVNGGELFRSLLGMSYLEKFRRMTVEGDRMVLVR